MVHRSKNPNPRMRRLLPPLSLFLVALMLPLGLTLAQHEGSEESDPLLEAWMSILSRYESHDHFLDSATEEDRAIYDAYMTYAHEELQRWGTALPEPEWERIVQELSTREIRPVSIGSIPLRSNSFFTAQSSGPTLHTVFTEADYDYTFTDYSGFAGATATVEFEDNMNRIGAWVGSLMDGNSFVAAGNGVYFWYTERVPLNESLVVYDPLEQELEYWSDPDGRYIYEVCYEYDLSRPGDALVVNGVNHYGQESGSGCVDVNGYQFLWGIIRANDGMHSESSLTLVSVALEPDHDDPVEASIQVSGYYGVFLQAWYGGYSTFNLYLIVCKADYSQCWNELIASHVDDIGGVIGDYYYDTFSDPEVFFELEPGVEYFAMLYAEGSVRQLAFWPDASIVESGYPPDDLFSQWYEMSLYYHE